MIFVYRTSVVGPSGTPLSDYEEGDIIKLNEGGSPVEFYVSKHDYESGLNGAGRTLVVRKDVYDNRAWNSTNVNTYATSSIDAWMNSTYKALFPEEIQTAMGTTTFYYTPGNRYNTVTTLERSLFLMSLTEIGKSDTYANTEGSALPIASTLQIVYYNGIAASQYLRTPYKNNSESVYAFGSDHLVGTPKASMSFGSRPAFTLPSTLLFNPDTNEVVA